MCEEGRTVLCGANAYEKKYYFNQAFDRIPDSIKDELHVICVLFTEEVGGIFLRTECAQDDFLYDEISSGLLVGEIRRKRQDMFEALSLYYRMFVLHEEAGGLFGEEDT